MPGVTYTNEGPAVPACPVCMTADRVHVVPAPRWNADARYYSGCCNLSFSGSQQEQIAQRAWEASKKLESPGWRSKAERVREARAALDGVADSEAVAL